MAKRYCSWGYDGSFKYKWQATLHTVWFKLKTWSYIKEVPKDVKQNTSTKRT